MAVSGVALGAVAAGSVFLYAGLKGVSVPEAVQAIVQGNSPATLGNRYPITTPTGPAAGAPGGPLAGSANEIVTIAASMKGQCYGFGAGHGNPCGSRCTDCSSYVSC